jgi:hypothetical protein
MEKESNLQGDKQELNIQWSSTSLANTGERASEAGVTLLSGLLSKESYTKTVFKKAEDFEKETKEYFPQAQFGVSVLPTMMDKETLSEFKGLLENGSIDIPYIINWLKLPVQKAKEIMARDSVSLKGLLGYGFEIAYAMTQASSKKDLKKSVEDTIEDFPKSFPITMRTCIENASDPKVLRVMIDLSKNNENVIYALEPNNKLVNTLSEYIEYVNNIKKDNPELEIGLDLDLTHLKEERNLQKILERLEGTKDFPLMISLGGTVLSEQNIKLDTHLPLNLQDDHVVKNLGEYYSALRFRNERMPSLVFETNPAEEGLFDNYKEFLKAFKKGMY